MAKFEFKNVVATAVAEVEAPQIVTISPTLFYNNPVSHAAAYEDAMTIAQNGIVRLPVYGSRQYVEIKPGEVFTVECDHEAEIAFYTSLCDRLDGKFIEVVTKEGVNPAPAAETTDEPTEDEGAEG